MYYKRKRIRFIMTKVKGIKPFHFRTFNQCNQHFSIFRSLDFEEDQDHYPASPVELADGSAYL